MQVAPEWWHGKPATTFFIEFYRTLIILTANECGVLTLCLSHNVYQTSGQQDVNLMRA